MHTGEVYLLGVTEGASFFGEVGKFRKGFSRTQGLESIPMGRYVAPREAWKLSHIPNNFLLP